VLDYAQKIRIKDLGILTNGILVEKYIDRLRQYLADRTISIVFSLDSLKSEMHNHIRNSNLAWESSINSLKTVSLLKKEYPEINFNVITIILNQNLEELLDLAIFLKSLGVNSLQFQALLPSNLKMTERGKSESWVSADRFTLLDETIDKLIEFKKKNPDFIKNSMYNLLLLKKYYRGAVTHDDVQCSSACKTVLVSNQGVCSTCFSSYGNLKRQNLKDIFASRKRTEAYRKAKRCSHPCLLPCFCDS